MSNPFTYVDSVSYTKKNLMRGSENDELSEKGYKPFLTNRSLSLHQDAILHANEMNLRSGVGFKLQYEYLLYSIRKRKRYANWKDYKYHPDETVTMIMEYFSYRRAKAEAALRVLTDDQLIVIKESLDRGGTV
jgi:Bacteriophage clamp loader A subunit